LHYDSLPDEHVVNAPDAVLIYFTLMKFAPQCLTCFIDDITGAMEMLKVPPQETLAVLQESLAYLLENLGKDWPPSYYITGLHRILKKCINLDVPFEDVRAACLASGMEIAVKVEQKAEALTGIDKFRFLVRWAVAANSLDFRTAGAGYDLSPASVEKTLEGYFSKGLALDHSEQIYSAAVAAKNIVYIPDNVGELPFDKLLVTLLSSYGAKVTVPMRGGAITSDAIMADAEKVQMSSAATQVILAGPDTLGISFSEMSADLSKALSEADLVIAKGQANYYVLSEFENRFPRATIACLLTAKCGLVWQNFGCTGKESVAAVIKKSSQQ
jgi:damage-control phosphatase, subfamily I